MINIVYSIDSPLDAVEVTDVDYTFTPDAATISLGTEVELAINSIADGFIQGMSSITTLTLIQYLRFLHFRLYSNRRTR